jgi:four helix bundle protein
MQKINFENLQIYQISEQLADQVWEIAQSWDEISKKTVGIQIIKSADSIGANIAEGSGRGSDQDYKRFLRIARGSLYETRHWLRRAYKRNLLSRSQIESITPVLEILTPKLNAYIGAIGKPKTKIPKPKTVL